MTCVILFIISENKQLHQIITMISRRIWVKKINNFFYDIRLWPVSELPANEKSLSISFACSSSSVCCVLNAKKFWEAALSNASRGIEAPALLCFTWIG